MTAAWALGLIALGDSQALYWLVRSELIKVNMTVNFIHKRVSQAVKKLRTFV